MRRLSLVLILSVLVFSSVALADFVDIFNKITSAIESSGQNSITGYQVLQPDLVVKSITSSSAFTAGKSVRFTATIENVNNGVTINNIFGTSFRLDRDSSFYSKEDVFLGAPPTEGSQLPLAAGATTTEQSDLWTAVAGTHTLRVCGDWLNQVYEAKEDNNCRDYTFTVSSASTSTTTIKSTTTTIKSTTTTIKQTTTTTLSTPAASCSTSLSPSTIAQGQTATFSWSSSGTTYCSIGGPGWSSTSTSGSRITGSLAPGTYTFSGTCKTATGYVTCPTRTLTIYQEKISTSTTSIKSSTTTISSSSSCIRNPPTVPLSPDTSTGPAGRYVYYNLKMKNNDNSACGRSTFSFSASCPEGFRCSSGSSSISPGLERSRSVYVKSLSSSADGIYPFSFNVVSSFGLSGSASGTYVITGSSNTAGTGTGTHGSACSSDSSCNENKNLCCITSAPRDSN